MPKREKPPSRSEPEPDFICLYRPGPGMSLHGPAEEGDPEAQFALGRLYFEGRAAESSSSRSGRGGENVVASYTPALDRNHVRAAEWLEKAAQQGHAEARRLLEVVKLQIKPGVH